MDTSTIHARVPASLAERAKDIAERDQRTLSGLVHRALAVYCAQDVERQVVSSVALPHARPDERV
jgi:hypothetical protein